MKNIHLIKTDKPSRLRQNKITKKYSLVTKGIDLTSYTPVNIYITSDEEIKEGDWLFDLDIKRIVKADSLKVDTSKAYGCWYYKKIILTTDQDLIKDGVQPIDDEFLEWFVKNPSCEEVEFKSFKSYSKDNYIIFIPQEEPKMIECYFIPTNNTSLATICGNCGKEKFLHTIGSGIKVSKSVILTKEEPKQETIEEAAEKMYKQSYDEFGAPTWDEGKLFHRKAGFIDGAKWQSERMYSEAIEFGKWLDDNSQQREYWQMKIMTMEELFKQFKKK